MMDENKTLDNILHAGREEFLKKGFQAASLRNIVKAAGVTTGAFYGYFPSKEALFDALVGEQYACFMGAYKKAQTDFTLLPPEEQPNNMGEISGDCMDKMVDYIYDNFSAFKLLLCCAEGTGYENLIHEMVEIEVAATHDFIRVLESLGHPVKPIDARLEHMLVSGMFSSFFEAVIHDMPKEQAVEFTKELRAFYTAGWKCIMGLDEKSS